MSRNPSFVARIGVIGFYLQVDIRTAIRQMFRRPGQVITVVLCLAIGVGTTIASFVLIKRVLLEPLPYPAPDKLVMVWENPPNTIRNPVSGPNFLDWKRQNRSFAALAAVLVQPFNLSGAQEPELVLGSRVSPGFFDVFGVNAALGRPPRSDESIARVAVISDRLWKRRFESSREVLGRTIQIDGEAYELIGVMPAKFEPATRWSLGQRMDIWVPFEPPSAPDQRDSHSMEVIGRLKDGVSIGQAQAEMAAIAKDLQIRYPDSNRDFGARVASLKDELVQRGRTPLLLLFAAALVVLIIACANIAGLLLARTNARSAELALRSSLGASRLRIVTQLLSELIPLGVLGGILGLVVATWGLHGLRALLPYKSWQVPNLAIDSWVWLFGLGLSVVACVFSGLPAALLAPGRNVSTWLTHGRGGVSGAPGRNRLRGPLIVAQLALALVLANASALLLTSFTRLIATDQGFEHEQLLTARLQLVGPRYSEHRQIVNFLGELQQRLQGVPGVQKAAVTTKLPLFGGNNGTEIIEGREGDFGPDGGPEVERSMVSPTYFQTARIPLIAGRELTDSDGEAPVAVINETFARIGWPGQSPLGKRIRSEQQWFTVVGVVGDVRQWGPERPARPERYRLFASAARYETEEYLLARPYVLLRTEGEPLNVASALKQVVKTLDPDQPISDLLTMRERVEQASSGRRFLTILVAILASGALILVATGIYGLMATIVLQRANEFGVRMALGATTRGVVGMVLRNAVRLALTGVGIGLAGVLATTPLLRDLLFDARPTDAWLLGVGVLVVVTTALAGAIVPSWRAARLDPVAALRAQ